MHRLLNIIIFTFLAAVAMPVGTEAQQRLGSSGGKKSSSSSTKKSKRVLEPSYAWEASMPLGTMEPSTIDTLYINYAQEFVPTNISSAWANTGNFGAEGLNMIWVNRPPQSDFYPTDPLAHWMPPLNKFKFYNTRQPMTLLGYSFGGGSEVGQDRLHGVFSGNANKRIQIGAYLDYLYSKGSYANQADKHFIYGFSGSYIGERYSLQASFFNYNLLNKENGGITDDLYITDPAEVQGGQTSVNTKQIPTNLNDAHTRVKGMDLFVNNRYSLGFERVERSGTDSLAAVTRFVPVTDFIYTLQVRTNDHIFTSNASPADTPDFWADTYYLDRYTYDRTAYTFVSNTAGVGLREGFHSWVKFGLTGFVTHEYSRYRLPSYDEYGPAQGSTPLPESMPGDIYRFNKLYVGARLASDRLRYIKFAAQGRIGIVGAAGEFDVDGRASGAIPLMGDTLAITAYARLRNTAPSPLMNHYRSNHFIWNNDFSNQQSFRFGGILNFPKSGTTIDVGTETLTNHIYFGANGLPSQASGGVQIFWARATQRLGYRALHWDNTVTYQATSNDAVVPLPALALYSNLYVTFKLARVLDMQMGVDCDYYTRYYAPAYQPATMGFCAQHDVKIGNYPFMNLYINFKLRKTRFFVMMSHINQGMTGSNYFALPHYPMNPRRFQLGLSVDFAN